MTLLIQFKAQHLICQAIEGAGGPKAHQDGMLQEAHGLFLAQLDRVGAGLGGGSSLAPMLI